MRVLVLTAWIVSSWMLLGTAEALAQSATASLAGEVRTEDGVPVADAVVQARASANGAVRTSVTDRRGRYRIDGLSPGNWTVVARLGDGGLSDSQGVDLHLQRTTRLDFTVGGGLAEHVTVTAEAPLVDRKETAGRLIVTGSQAEGLPMAGRVFTDLALLDSSVSRAAPGNNFGERGAVFTVNGQSGRSNSFLVDGLDNNDSTSGTTLNSFFSQQVIQEFVLLTHQYSAEFGRASGGLLNVVTRRGGNDRVWGGFAQGTAGSWNAPGALIDSVPEAGVRQESARRFQTGISTGGPFVRDRAFYFAAYEHQSNDEVVGYTGLDRSGAEGGRFVAPSRDDNFFLRTDFNLGSSNTLMIRLSGDDRETGGVNVGGVYTPEAGFRIAEQDLQLAATWTHVISQGVLGETRFLASSSKFDQFANSSRVGVNHPSGIWGGNTLQRQRRDEDKFELVQNFTLVRGAHTFKFGLDVTHSRTRVAAGFNPNGNLTYDYDFSFDNGDCGDLGVSDLQGALPDGTVPCPDAPDMNGNGQGGDPANAFGYPVVYALVRGEPRNTLNETQFAVFAQDRAEVGRRWLLDYGLRYDVSSYRLPPGAAVESTIPNGGAKRDRDNIAPRFGFTFTPKVDGRLVIRGGGGIFYDKLVLAFPAVAAITSGTEILLLFPQGTADERVNEFHIEENGLEGILADAEELAPLLDPLILRFSTATELDTPYTVQFNLGLERGVGRFSSIRANLVRALGYNVPLMRDLNPVSGLVEFPPSSIPCTADQIIPDAEIGIPCHLGDPVNVGSIAALTTDGRSWYTGVDLGYRWQRDDAWLRASYTWSESEDLGFDPLKGGISLPQDSIDLTGERGRSDGHQEHRLVLSGASVLPWMGLHASTVIQLASGMPFHVTTGQDDNLDGFLNDRPAGVDRNAGADASLDAINGLRNQAVVPLQPITSLDEPSFFQVDLRLSRPFGMRNGKNTGTMFLQIFNALGRDNWGLVEGRAISPNFGRPITLAGSPRTFELGLRLTY